MPSRHVQCKSSLKTSPGRLHLIGSPKISVSPQCLPQILCQLVRNLYLKMRCWLGNLVKRKGSPTPLRTVDSLAACPNCPVSRNVREQKARIHSKNKFVLLYDLSIFQTSRESLRYRVRHFFLNAFLTDFVMI